jgi:hypothetical protein
MRCLGLQNTPGFLWLNCATAFISMATAIYLLPMVPNVMNTLDDGLQQLVRLNEETVRIV